MKRPLIVFAGQSNMLGAPVFEVDEQIYYRTSTEYLHKPRRFGKARGEFKLCGFPVGEFSYIDLDAAYGTNRDPEQKSKLIDYREKVYFGAAMSNLKSEDDHSVMLFSNFGEANNREFSPSLAPFFVQELEKRHYACSYAHIAKGGVPIRYYLDGGAAEYFLQKSADFFEDAAEMYAGDDLSEKILIWHQGESDGNSDYETYKAALYELWERAKRIGFTRFFMIRIGYWGHPGIWEIMRAQEDFCNECAEAEMITRAASYIPWPNFEWNEWLSQKPEEELENCRDSFYGFNNNHINERGFRMLA